MSAIGDYVHLTATNYMSNKTRPPYFSDASSAIATKQAMLDNYLSKTTSANVTNMQKGLNKILDSLNPVGANGKHSYTKVSASSGPSTGDAINDAILKDMLDLLQEKFGPAAAFNTNLEKKSNKLADVPNRINNVNRKDLVATFSHSIDKLYVALNSIQQGISTTQQLKSSLNKIEKEYQRLIKAAHKELKKVIKEEEKAGNKKYKYTTKELEKREKEILKDFLKNSDLIASLNSIINCLHAPSSTGFTGDIAETFTLAALERCGFFGASEGMKKIRWTGGSPAIAGYYVDNFGRTLNIKDFVNNSVETIENGQFIITNKNSYDKSDLVVQMSDNSSMGISVKNYSWYFLQNKGLHLLSGAPFLSLIQNENEDDFVNHYLNLNARRRWKGGSIAKTEQVSKTRLASARQKKEINKVMQQLILIKAASGYRTIRWDQAAGKLSTQTNAEIFIMYIKGAPGHSSVQAVVVPMTTLINNIMKSGFKVDIPIWIPNDWTSEGPDERITKMLAYLHKYKISVIVPYKNIESTLNLTK